MYNTLLTPCLGVSQKKSFIQQKSFSQEKSFSQKKSFCQQISFIQQLCFTRSIRCAQNGQTLKRCLTLLPLVIIFSATASDPLSRAQTHYDLGLQQLQNHVPAQALKSFHSALELQEQHFDSYHPRLEDSLAELARAQYQTQQYEKALDSLHRLQNILHRNYGVWTLKQSEYILWLGNVYQQLNNAAKANTMANLHYKLYRNNHPAGSVELVAPLLRLAAWQRQSAQYTLSILSYEQALQIIKRREINPSTLAQAMAGLAETRFLASRCCADELLEKAALTLAAADEISPARKREAFMAAADMNLLMGKVSQSQALYKKASAFHPDTINTAKLLGVGAIPKVLEAYRPNIRNEYYPALKKDSKQQFQPRYIHPQGYPLPMCPSELSQISRREDMRSYVVDLDIEVSPSGRASQVEITASNAPHALNRLLRRVVKLIKFRPKLVDGEAVKDTFAFRQTFADKAPTDKTQLHQAAGLANAHACFLLAATLY